MIAPEPRLVAATAAVTIGGSLLYALDAQTAPLAVLAFMTLLLLGILDALRATRSQPPFTITLPRKADWVRGIPAELSCACAADNPGAYLPLRVSIPWPRHITFEDEFLPVTLTPDQPEQRLQCPLTPTARSAFAIEKIFADAPSPWGLWRVRHAFPAHCDVQVHANLLKERNKSAALFLNRAGVGSRAIRQVGRGREFEQLREYLPGDSFEDIFWKGTARRGFPVTKTYQLEQVQEVYTLIDASRLSARSFGPRHEDDPGDTYLEHFITTALLLSAVAGRQHDRFGLATFSNKVNTFLRAGAGRSHFNSCRDALTRTAATTANPDFEELFIHLRQSLRRRALLVFLTNLDDPLLAEQFCQNIHLLSRTHLVLVCLLTPPGARPVFTGAEPEDVPGIYHRLGGHLQWQQLRELQRSLTRLGVNAALLEREHHCTGVIEHYLNIKKRQLL